MKTPEQLKESLDACFEKMTCAECDYDIGSARCLADMCRDAKVYIEQLEEQIDLMLIQMHGDCGVCKHRETLGAPCIACVTSKEDKPNWEYEGLPELARKENK